MVVTYWHAVVQGQQSVSSEDIVETNGRTDRRTEAIALPPTLMRSGNMLLSVALPNADQLSKPADAASTNTLTFRVRLRFCCHSNTTHATI